MKRQEVRQMAKEFNISIFGKKKEALIREIQRAEGNFDCFKTASTDCDQMTCRFRSVCLEGVLSRPQ